MTLLNNVINFVPSLVYLWHPTCMLLASHLYTFGVSLVCFHKPIGIQLVA